MRVLVVDDSPSMRVLIGEHLRELGFDVHEAGSGIDGLRALRQLRGVALVLVDWNMPEMDGFEFLQALSALPERAAFRVMTLGCDPSQAPHALAAGACQCMTHPFDPHDLREKLLLLGIVSQRKAA